MTRRALLGPALAVVLLIGCSGPTPPSTDAGSDAPADAGSDTGLVCTADPMCDDGLFCNGAERCMPANAMADARGCVDASAPACATTDRCDEDLNNCVGDCDVADSDGDGVDSLDCGGSDCDDADARRFPGNTEVCDAELDEDCNPATFGADGDIDTYVDDACCNRQPDGALFCGADCDDTMVGVNPGSPEACNGIDDDCDGAVDEGVVPVWYRDADMDGFGSATAATMTTCLMPAGYVAANTDCLDSNALAHPGGREVCDSALVDEDCSGAGNDRTPPCDCIDGTTSACTGLGVCATRMRNCIDGVWGLCPYTPLPETCPPNMLDDNCNGLVDEGIAMTTCYVDVDLDGYPSGTDSRTMRVCGGVCPAGYTARLPTAVNVDCADLVPAAHPTAMSQTMPYCADPANAVCVQGAVLTCIAPASSCPSASLGVASFDYDCDGTATPDAACGPCGTACACR